MISVSPSNDDQTLLDLETLQTLLDQLKSPLVSSVMVGHYEDSKSSKHFTRMTIIIPNT